MSLIKKFMDVCDDYCDLQNKMPNVIYMNENTLKILSDEYGGKYKKGDIFDPSVSYRLCGAEIRIDDCLDLLDYRLE